MKSVKVIEILEKQRGRGNTQKDKGQGVSSNYNKNQITVSRISENIKTNINNTQTLNRHKMLKAAGEK